MENENAVARPGNWVRNLFKVSENAAAKPRTWVRRLVKIVAYVSVALVALYVVASAAWRYSGSNNWEFTEERNGVKVYTLKSPGSDLTQVKGIAQVRSTLGGLMKLLLEPGTGDDHGFSEMHTIERVDDQLGYMSIRFNLPFPFQTREFVVRSQIHQNPRTKEVLAVFAAAPDKAPPSNCCFRVTEMNNTWRLTPLEDGQVEVELVQNAHLGGFVPDLWLNKLRPKVLVEMLSTLQDTLNKKKLQDAKLDFIKEK